ncbi:MAG: PleD family two-component system response regulator [Dongiaceae bacterium]
MPGRVLVVDDVPANVKLLEAKLTQEFFDVVTAADGLTALQLAESSAPDVILLDVMMPGMDGFTVCRKLKENRMTAHIPVVLVTALSEIHDRVQGLQAGADDFLTKPVNDIALFARVRSLIRLKMTIEEWRLREQTAQQFGALPLAQAAADDDGKKAMILLIETNPIEASNIIEIVKEDGHQLQGVNSIEDGLRLAAEKTFDLIIVGVALAEDTALRLSVQLRNIERARNTPILLVADEDDKERLAKSLDLGVSDYIVNPIERDELLARCRTQVKRRRFQDRLRQNYEQSLSLALTDTLTGVYNRRYFNTHFEEMLLRAKNSDKTLGLIMIDIDHFKSVNDRFGHPAGDRVLKEVAARINRSIRHVDLVARLGGEEFAVVMPDTNMEIAQNIAERLRLAIANEPIEVGDGHPPLTVTISLGLALSPGGGEDVAHNLMKTADILLYEAKKQGRNRVMIAA